MNIEFDSPIVIQSKGCHCFNINDAPIFESISTASELRIHFDSHCSGQLQEFVELFLSKAAVHFSKPLPVPIFLERLSHQWNTSEFTEKELTFNGHCLLKWIPANIFFYKGRYEIEWLLIEILDINETVADSSATNSDTPKLEVTPDSVAIQEIPLSSVTLSSIEQPSQPSSQSIKLKRNKLKQKIRRARLRVTLAQLRAEKLAERYYLRYGELNLEDSDSDSDLSYASDL